MSVVAVLSEPRGERRRRERLARWLEELVATAERRPGRRAAALTARVPVDAGEVLRARHELLDLAALLHSGAPVDRAGLRVVKQLVSDGTGPVYVHLYEGDVADAAECARRALRS
jgi:hypothetical protein